LEDNIPDLIHEETEENLHKIYVILDKTFSSSVNNTHIDLERFYLSLKSHLEAIPDHPDQDDFKKMDMTDFFK